MEDLIGFYSRNQYTLYSSVSWGYVPNHITVEENQICSGLARLGTQISNSHTKMPDGTYYTPQDLVDEMTSEVLGRWLHGKMPDLPPRQIRDLAHPVPGADSWTGWTPAQRAEAERHLGEVTVLDPSCGSGAYTVGMLLALARARRRLCAGRAAMRDVIERQLHAVDIHPLAVLITLLRLYVALVEAESVSSGGKTFLEGGAPEILPLPNLETRFVTANTLYTAMQHQSAQEEFGAADWDKAFGDWRAALELWVTAYTDEDKATVREDEGKARAALKNRADWKTGVNLDWLDVNFLADPEKPVAGDARMILARPDGWDIVIGNPPYQKPSPDQKELGEKLGYCTAGVNLYTMFIEASLELSSADGCICLVVPNSVVFKSWRATKKLRRSIEDSGISVRVELRTYDNRPQPVFPRVEWLSSPESRQRVTVMTVSKGVPSGDVGVHSAGLVRLEARTRAEIFRAEPRMVEQPRYSSQWTQAPTRETALLLEKMRRDSKRTDIPGGGGLPTVCQG